MKKKYDKYCFAYSFRISAKGLPFCGDLDDLLDAFALFAPYHGYFCISDLIIEGDYKYFEVLTLGMNLPTVLRIKELSKGYYLSKLDVKSVYMTLKCLRTDFESKEKGFIYM